VLGEIPDQEQALREVARVLKPGGRLVVGELFGDPHMVTSGRLRERSRQAGLRFQRRLGNPLAFFERFEAPLAGSG
jgi:ubiquinone/menaquinone biosynthesis C-methylase UbiE